MKTLYLILAILLTGMVASAQENTVSLKRTGSSIELNNDSTGMYFSDDAIGFKSVNAGIGIARINGEKFLVFATSYGGEPKGILMKEDGSAIQIACDTIIIKRKCFSSHAEADLSLLPGEEYYLTGDRNLFHIPEN